MKLYIGCHGESGEGASPVNVHPDRKEVLKELKKLWPTYKRDKSGDYADPVGCDLFRIVSLEVPAIDLMTAVVQQHTPQELVLLMDNVRPRIGESV